MFHNSVFTLFTNHISILLTGLAVLSDFNTPLLFVYSVDGILLSRTVDPLELLMDLGFGGPEKSYMARIPARFFKETKVGA